MKDRTEYVGPPDLGRSESFVSIWIVGAVALIALFTLAGLYVAHYSMTKRIDAMAALAKQERAELSGKISGLQQQLRRLEQGGAVAAEPGPADEAQPADDADDAPAAPARAAKAAPDEATEAAVSVSLESVPAGAQVLEGKNELGVTPLALELRPGQRKRVKLMRRGYRPQWVMVSDRRPSVKVRLARVKVQFGAKPRAKAKQAATKDKAEDTALFNPYGD